MPLEPSSQLRLLGYLALALVVAGNAAGNVLLKIGAGVSDSRQMLFGLVAWQTLLGMACFGFGLLQVDDGLVVGVGGDRGILLGYFDVRGVGCQLHLESSDLPGGVIDLLPGALDLLLARHLGTSGRGTDAGRTGQEERGDESNTST